MDDNHIPTLKESQNEWSQRLMKVILSHILDGAYGMFAEGKEICDKADEPEKYLMTFQNILSRVPKWNNEIVLKETARIVERSGCGYLEDLITCVHISHLKILSSIRTGKTPKKIEINIPKLPDFIHCVYIHVSRQLYSNVYLFDPKTTSLVVQKNKEKIKDMVRLCILDTIRDNIPIENLLRAYLDESTDLLNEHSSKKEKDKEKEKENEKELRFAETAMAVNEDNVESVYEPPVRTPEINMDEFDDAPMKILDDIPLSSIEIEDLIAPTPIEIVLPDPIKEEFKLEFEELK
jgi:hypothetical protein